MRRICRSYRDAKRPPRRDSAVGIIAIVVVGILAVLGGAKAIQARLFAGVTRNEARTSTMIEQLLRDGDRRGLAWLQTYLASKPTPLLREFADRRIPACRDVPDDEIVGWLEIHLDELA